MSLDANRNLYWKRKAAGVCTKCGKGSDGKLLCPKCNEKHSARTTRLRKAYVARGLCYTCGKRPPERGAWCAECIAQAFLRIQEHTAKKVAYLIEFKLKVGCIECGYREHHAGLQFDHIPGRGEKIDEVSAMAHNNRAWAVIKTEIAKCEVVCATHHAVRTWERQNGCNTHA